MDGSWLVRTLNLNGTRGIFSHLRLVDILEQVEENEEDTDRESDNSFIDSDEELESESDSDCDELIPLP
jgi:hypothetical protein